MEWKRNDQGLDINFTAKGKTATLYVGISYGNDVLMCKQYTGRLNAERFCKIIIQRIDDSIQNSSKPRAKRILQNT